MNSKAVGRVLVCLSSNKVGFLEDFSKKTLSFYQTSPVKLSDNDLLVLAEKDNERRKQLQKKISVMLTKDIHIALNLRGVDVHETDVLKNLRFFVNGDTAEFYFVAGIESAVEPYIDITRRVFFSIEEAEDLPQEKFMNKGDFEVLNFFLENREVILERRHTSAA